MRREGERERDEGGREGEREGGMKEKKRETRSNQVNTDYS